MLSSSVALNQLLTLYSTYTVVPSARTDFLINGATGVRAIDNPNHQAASALYTGLPAATPSKYRTTSTYRASNDAAGTFTISVRSEATMLRDANTAPVNWEPGDTVEMLVE